MKCDNTVEDDKLSHIADIGLMVHICEECQ